MDLLFNTIMLEPNRWTTDHKLCWPLVDLLEPIAEAGFPALEVWGYHVDRLAPSAVESLAAALRTHQQAAVAVGAYPSFHLEGAEDDAEQQRLQHVVEASAALGARVFKIFPGRVASAAADSVWARSLERLRALAGELAEHEMTLTLETHGNTLCDTLDSTRRVLDELSDVANLGICFQPYAEHDTDQAMAAFDALAPHVLHLHLQNRAAGERAVTLLEEGDWTDYTRFLPHVQAAGFGGVICLEFTAGITPPEGQAFDLATVLGNAMLDRRFVERLWLADSTTS